MRSQWSLLLEIDFPCQVKASFLFNQTYLSNFSLTETSVFIHKMLVAFISLRPAFSIDQLISNNRNMWSHHFGSQKARKSCRQGRLPLGAQKRIPPQLWRWLAALAFLGLQVHRACACLLSRGYLHFVPLCVLL